MPRDGEALYVARFLSEDESRAAFAELRASLAWEQPRLVLFGRPVDAPRLEAWYGDAGAGYRYSGLAHDPLPWTPLLAALRDRVAAVAGCTFNSVLANLYRDGRDSNGWHADDERELGREPTIASLSLGAPRRFRFRRKDDRRETVDALLLDGSLVLMRGRSQECWQHTVPKERDVHAPRINLTFRTVAARKI